MSARAAQTLKPAAQDLANRRLAWDALSDLFLDTDVSLSQHWRARQLAGLPYSIDELEHILVSEIYPICKWNLVSVAGVWSGFDQAWLEGEILRRAKSPLRKLALPSLFGKRFLRNAHWRATRSLIEHLRDCGEIKADI